MGDGTLTNNARETLEMLGTHFKEDPATLNSQQCFTQIRSAAEDSGR